MKTLSYQLSFHTPAFLGNAEQSGQWRTPPFKALLRQWWRVAWMADKDFRGDMRTMREEEGKLFGNAWLENNFSKSQLRLRLSSWAEGQMQNWQPLATVNHPEVPKAVGSDLYLGYGPITLPRGENKPKPKLKSNAAIQAGESAIFSIAVPEEASTLVEQALWLMDRYATAGGRSRNGWGSFSLTPLDDTPALAGELPSRDWQQALQLDWPHAIGSDDNGPLIWQTQAHSDWQSLMRELAAIKIDLRTKHFKFPNEKPPHRNIEDRHWLSYPITRHTTQAWDKGLRIPNSLRFKARVDPRQAGKLVGVITHVPAVPPVRMGNEQMKQLTRVWQTVYALLDNSQQVKRTGE